MNELKERQKKRMRRVRKYKKPEYMSFFFVLLFVTRVKLVKQDRRSEVPVNAQPLRMTAVDEH